MKSEDRYAVVSCHVERPLDNDVWAAFERLLRRRPAGFTVTALIRPPDTRSGEDQALWLERARRADELGPLGHHTHWGGPTQARPAGDADAAELVRTKLNGFVPKGSVRSTSAAAAGISTRPSQRRWRPSGTSTAARRRSDRATSRTTRRGCSSTARVRCSCRAARCCASCRPRTRSACSRAVFATLRGPVHLHFHDWELLDRRRALALEVVLRALRLRRRPIDADELVRRTAEAPLLAWPTATISAS